MPRALLSSAAISDFRAQLCAVAERQFAEHGYPGVTLRALAAELGVSAMTPYRYFRNKEEIFAFVRAAGFRRFADEQVAASAANRDPLARLAALGRSYLGFARREPHAYRIMFEMNPLGTGDGYTELATQQMRGWQPLQHAVAVAVAAGALQGDPEQLAHVYWAAWHGLSSLDLAGTYAFMGQDVDAVAQCLMRTLVTGSQPSKRPAHIRATRRSTRR